MISISNNSLKKYSKIIVLGMFVYSFFFMTSSIIEYYQSYKDKERLTNELQLKREETSSLKQKITNLKEKTKKVQESYIAQDELRTRVAEIFDRVSLLDYQLKLLDTKPMCIDRHILVVSLFANSEDGYKAGEGILNYLGTTAKSSSEENLYFVNYITKPRSKK